MRSYHVNIVMPDGSHCCHVGLYRTAGDAATYAINTFPEAARIVVLRLTTVLLGGAHRMEAKA
jgi:hypothetical protein